MNHLVKSICSILILIVLTPNSSRAIEWGEHEISVQLDFTYTSQYMWKGFDTFSGQGSFQPSLELGYENWFAGVWQAFPDTSGFDDLTETDLYAGYYFTLFEEKPWATDITLMYTYFAFPKTDSSGDVQELAFETAWPNLFAIGESSIIPRYAAYYEFSGVQSSRAIDDGWYQTLGFDWEIPVNLFDDEEIETLLTLSSEITHNDGAFATDAGFSHATFGSALEFAWKRYYLTPALYFQKSMEDTVNDEDELWAMISIGVLF